MVLFEALSTARPATASSGRSALIEGTDKTTLDRRPAGTATTNFLHAIPHFAVTVALSARG